MASNGNDELNTPNDESMLAPIETPKKKRGRPRKSDCENPTPRKSARQAEKKQTKKELVLEATKVSNGVLESDEEWSFDEEDEDYLSTMFKKLHNPVAIADEDEDEEEEDDEDEDEEDEEDGLFQDDSKDVYDFDQQSSVMSKQEPRMTRRWLSQQPKRGQARTTESNEGSSWGSNIYSHVATLLNSRDDLEIYSQFLKCSHVNRGLDFILADLCKPFRSTTYDGPSASLRILVTSINDAITVVSLLRNVVSDHFENAAHRISNFVVVVQQPICGLRFCTGSTDSLHFSDILHSIDPKIAGDAAFLVEADKADTRRTVADVDTVVVSDTFNAVINEHFLSATANKLQRIVIGLDENKSLFGIFVLDVWNRAGVPFNRPRKYAAATFQAPSTSMTPQGIDTTMEFVDAFFVRMGGKKGVLHLVAKLDSRFQVYNIVSEYNFAFKKHGLSPNCPIMLEGMYSTFPEVLGEEKSVLVVPDQLYRSLTKTLAREVSSPNCRFKKSVLLDKRTRLPLSLFFETEVTMDLQIEDKVVSALPLSILPPSVVQNLKPTTQNIMLVSLNGILVGFEISAQKSVSKCYELVSDNRAAFRPHIDRRQSVQTTYLSPEGSSITLQLSNLEIHENTFVSASLYENVPFCKRQEHIEQFLNDVADRIFDLPLKVSLLDSIFRLHQRASHTVDLPLSLAAGAPPPPPPVTPLLCQCVFCGREFRTASLYDHEVRHLGLVKFKCRKHQMFFSDMKTYRGHREEFLDCDGNSENETEIEAQKLLNISATITECPQCQKCYDYFPQADLLAQHMDMCDGVSFSARTPLDNSNKPLATTAANDQVEFSNTCGLCGLNYPRMETLCGHMHTHLSCHVCKTRLCSVEEVSAHIRDHVARKDVVSGRGIRKIFSCDICGDFYGTKINYYYHQWHEHGVVHPPVKAEDGNQGPTAALVTGGQPANQSSDLISKRRWKKNDELSYNATGSKKFRCKFCRAEVKVSGRAYLKHLDTKHGLTVDSDSVCRICAEVFETAERLSEHLRARHLQGGQYVNAGVQSIFSCDKCTFFGHFVGVVGHSTTVHCDPSPCLYECPHCPERMADRRLWRLHLEKHEEPMIANVSLATTTNVPLIDPVTAPPTDDDSQFDLMVPGAATECDICKKSCKTMKAFELHRIKHFRTRIFQCTECQATFRSKLAMRRHIRVDHLNLEPERYECQICGKIVTQISMHMLIHKNARYQCEFCDKRFTKSAYYNEHVRIHKGEKPYECHICQRKFNKKSNLNVHISFHEKHRDDYGNYLEIKPRGRGHPDYDPEKTRARKTAMIKYDAGCGPDLPGLCLHDDCTFKMANVSTNSKACDTDDLHTYLDMLYGDGRSS